MDTFVSKIALVIGSDFVKKIVPLIDKATKSLTLMMFEWRWDSVSATSDLSLLNSAIIRACQRGVRVSAISNFGDILQKLKEMGAQAKIWASDGNMHAKILVIDGEICVIGSHNFSANAFLKNVELSVLFSDIAVAAQIKNYFDILWRQ